MQPLNSPLRLPEAEKKSTDASIVNFAQAWAKKYVQNLESEDNILAIKIGRSQVAKILQESLRSTSLDAWYKTERLISKEMKRHQINPRLVDPWHITEDSFRVFEKVIEVYAKQASPQRLAIVIGSDVGGIRKKYTAEDPRIIGFVSMQFHYTGQILLSNIPESERDSVRQYFKVIDDHLYMPLQRAYDAAANYDFDSPILAVVQKLLPLSREIAIRICERVITLYSNYATYSGNLSEPVVKIATIRDVEMFQVYLWVCVLEQSIAAVQQELFPLAVMLYPTLKVRWELVRQMIHLLKVEIKSCLGPKELSIFAPYLEVLWEMFSPEIFPDTL
ncbi:MAG TPA: hypothetical protein DDZ80_22670 [Cyanobacteria bacterium UBA8803]|nr:hypothetical protein [Cyanobacteria bacterium UBA9273]HBL61130.1 hypothetical protein [Cyanobacteria bacterium UBA8803]